MLIGKDGIVKIADYPVVSNWSEFMRQLPCNNPGDGLRHLLVMSVNQCVNQPNKPYIVGLCILIILTFDFVLQSDFVGRRQKSKSV